MFAKLLGFIVGCLLLLPTYEMPLSFLGEGSKEHESCGRLQNVYFFFGGGKSLFTVGGGLCFIVLVI